MPVAGQILTFYFNFDNKQVSTLKKTASSGKRRE
jgi:hypothetical protein